MKVVLVVTGITADAAEQHIATMRRPAILPVKLTVPRRGADMGAWFTPTVPRSLE